MKENKNYISTSKRNIGLANELDLGKLPPQALDLEESVLGALMLEKDILIKANTTINNLMLKNFIIIMLYTEF